MYRDRLFRFALALVLAGLAGNTIATEKIDINHADAISLAEALNGIGAGKAKAIVAWREAHGPFKRLDDLLEVKGIGEATLDHNRDLIEFAPEATTAHSNPSSRSKRARTPRHAAAAESPP